MTTDFPTTFRPQFAVVREDPNVELDLIDRSGCAAGLVVASGGCTALTLSRLRPGLSVTAFDRNPAQLAHARSKADETVLSRLNVGDANPAGLNQCGAFEGLFRVLRVMLTEFVAPAETFENVFRVSAGERARLVEHMTSHRFWPTSFEVAFAEPMLRTMFGPDALQHAAPGSYPAYFRAAFERGLSRGDAPENPFLHHVLLGRYLAGCAPEYIGRSGGQITWVQGTLLDVPDLSRFGLISLSNIFDWSDDSLVAAWAERLRAECVPGSVVVMRQLNNHRPLRPFFEPAFRFDDARGEALLADDRSLFYNRIEVAIRG